MTPLAKLHALHALAETNQASFERAKSQGLDVIAAELRATQKKIEAAMADHVRAEMSPRLEAVTS